MSTLKSPTKKVAKNRIPNAFMIFVKEQNRNLLQNCPEEERARLGAYLGRKWRSMSVEEKQVYYDKFNILKENQKDKCDSSAAVEENVKSKNGRCTEEVVSDNNCSVNESFSAEQSFHKHSNQLANVDDLSAKQNISKKGGRPPNAFFIFAKEQRHTIKKDKKVHYSIVLGNMWRDLPASEKAKYYLEAKRQLTLHRKNQPASEKIPKRKKKVLSETVPNKSTKRPRGRKKISCDVSSNLVKEANDTEQTTIASNSKILDKFENTGSTNPPSESLAVNEYPTSTCLHQHNSSINNLHRMAPVVDAHLSMPCCCQSSSYASHGCANLKQNSASSTEMSPPFLGSASFPPIFPSYSFNTSPWMYPPPLAPQWFPFSMPSFYPSPYRWPYSHESSYVGYYASQYGVIGPSTHDSSNPTISETATSASSKDESTEIGEKNGISEEEHLIVDEDPSEEQ